MGILAIGVGTAAGVINVSFNTQCPIGTTLAIVASRKGTGDLVDDLLGAGVQAAGDIYFCRVTAAATAPYVGFAAPSNFDSVTFALFWESAA